MKRFFAKIHLWLSIPVGLFLAIICLTGASLVFEQEITRALNGDCLLYTSDAADEP